LKTLSELVADARNIHDILDVLGLTAGRERVIVCPLPSHVHKRNTPSFSVFWRRGMQWWRCHGSCDLEGDIVDLIGYLRVPGYDKRDPDKIRAAVNLLDERYEIKIPAPQPETELRGNEYLAFLPPGPEVIEYAAGRGLTEDTLTKFRVGQYGHYMTMPTFEEKILKGIKMRNLWKCAPEKRFWMLEGSRLGLFNYDAIYLTQRPVFIVKGEIPAMLMDQIGFPYVCAPSAGEGSGRKAIYTWNTALALSPKIVIGDNDGPGRELGKKRAILFGAKLFFPPEEFKDIDEWILADQTGAKDQLEKWANQTMTEWWS
jgi:hypothetical protein